MAAEKLKRELGFRDVVLFYIVSGLSLRWIATAAASGQSAIVVWLLAWCGFFLPLAGCVLELSSRYPQEGGLYVWTREAFGEFAAFMAGWTYWMSNLPYFAAVLYFAASSLLFASPRGQHLADTNLYFLLFTISMLARFLANPGIKHMDMVQHCFQYLKGTSDYWLELGGPGTLRLAGFSDADGSTMDGSKAISRSVFRFG